MKMSVERGTHDYQLGTYTNIFISDAELMAKQIEENLLEKIADKVSDEFLSQRMPSIIGGLVLQQEQIPKLVMEKIVGKLVEKMMKDVSNK